MYARIPALCVMFFCLSMPLDLRAEDDKDLIKRSIRVQVLLVESDTDLSEDEWDANVGARALYKLIPLAIILLS